jgi:hypothetical protein
LFLNREEDMIMESERIYEDSYKYIETLCKENTTDSITIDYKLLDQCTACELRQAIHDTIFRRKKEIGNVIFKAR